MVVTSRDGDGRCVGRAGATVHGECRAGRLITVSSGDGVGRDAFSRNVQRQPVSLEVERKTRRNRDTINRASNRHKQLLFHTRQSRDDRWEHETGRGRQIIGEGTLTRQGSEEEVHVEARSALVGDDQ